MLISEKYSKKKSELDTKSKNKIAGFVRTNQKKKDKDNKKKNQLLTYKTCNRKHKGQCYVETEEIPQGWSSETKKRLQKQINKYKANENKPLVVSNTKKSTGSQESGKKKKKKGKQPDQLIVSTLYLPPRMPVKPID
jgi:hypothetical protein